MLIKATLLSETEKKKGLRLKGEPIARNSLGTLSAISQAILVGMLSVFHGVSVGTSSFDTNTVLGHFWQERCALGLWIVSRSHHLTEAKRRMRTVWKSATFLATESVNSAPEGRKRCKFLARKVQNSFEREKEIERGPCTATRQKIKKSEASFVAKSMLNKCAKFHGDSPSG